MHTSRRTIRLFILPFLISILLSSSAFAQKCGTAGFLLQGKTVHDVQLDLPLQRISESGRFAIHYSLEGPDAVTPAFLDSTEAILDQCWTLQVENMGYPAPIAGEGGFIHVHLQDLPTLYGYTLPYGSSGTNLPGDMVLDNNYLNAAHATRGINGLRVTIAHEFFHLIHFAMRLNPFHLYFYEWSATWMEEVAFSQINDYIYYLPGIYNDPAGAIRTMDGVREYATALLLMTITDLAGEAVVHEAWVRFAATNGDPFEHLLEVMEEVGFQREVVAQTYAARVMISGQHAIEGFGFTDARWFPSFSLNEGNCGDLRWCGTLGEWGMLGGVLPGGVQGRAGLGLEAEGHATGFAAVREGDGATILPVNSTGTADGTWGVAGAISLMSGEQQIMLSATPERAGRPAQIEITPVWPNPSNGGFTWQMRLDRPGTIEVSVYNLLGREVHRMITTTGVTRTARLSWDGRDTDGRETASGVYILHAVAGEAQAAQRAVLIR